jgi:23S rRNA (adenine-N6)-dimethyltransferase
VAVRRARSARADARRGLDQHFLRSTGLAAELVRGAAVGRDDFVLELGAGKGRLTAELARAAGRVLAVELDPRLAGELRRSLGRKSNVTVLEGDGLDLALPVEPFRVLANLPFGRTTAFLRRFLDDPLVPLERADLIVEWGVALKRSAVWPSTLLGASWGAWWTFRIDRRLAAACFEPAPSVDAAVLVIARRDPPLVPAAEAGAYHDFVARGFNRGLKSVASPRHVRRIARRSAPRDLDAHQWAALFRESRAPRNIRRNR